MFDPHLSRSRAAEPSMGDRRMKVSPLDLRQVRFRTAFRGFDRAEVLALITEVADDYENALREVIASGRRSRKWRLCSASIGSTSAICATRC
jgi:DivIVA domain-containing protein